jgi:ESS family glutamate:Na+ symporter
MGNPFIFDPVLAFAAIGSFLILGVILRAKVGVFQSFLLPSCLVGGMIGCIVLNLKLIDISFTLFENIAYHFLNIAFISVGLTQNTKKENSDKKSGVLRGAIWMSLMKGITWPLQAIIGLLYVLFFTTIGQDLFPSFGLFLPLGFNEGPGPALALGKVYEGFGFQHASTIGLSFALMGYFFCFFVGMPFIRAGLKKGSAKYGQKSLPDDFLRGIMPKDHGKTDPEAPKKTLYPENIDNLAFQFALIGVAYIITYFICSGLATILPINSQKVVWGFFFGFGLLVGIIITQIMKKTGIAHLVDPGTQHRITGFSLDFMIAGTLMAIQLAIVWIYIIPILAISISGGFMTVLVILYFGKRQDDMALERTVVVYGTYTGQLSTGLLLLRIVDPEFRSSLLLELGLFGFIVAPITFSCMIFATGQVSWGWGIWQTIGIYAVIALISLILMKVLKFWGKPQKLF